MNFRREIVFSIAFISAINCVIENDHPSTNDLTTTTTAVHMLSTPVTAPPTSPSTSMISLQSTPESITTTTTTTTPAPTTTSTTTTTTTTDPTLLLLEPKSNNQTTPGNTCFYAEPELCPNKTSNCECNLHPTIPNSLVCCNVTDINKSIICAYNSSQNSLVNIHIRNAVIDDLNIAASSRSIFKRLNSLVITDGYIKKISESFPKFSSLACLNVSKNNISEISQRAFKELSKLQVLDISHNNLTQMPLINSLPSNLTLDIRGNDAMLCKSVLDLVERFKFVDPDSTFCLTNSTFNWFNSTDSIPLRQLERMKQLQSECPIIPGYGNCTCVGERLNYQVNVIFTAKVDCSNMGLVEMPEKLPQNTVSLNVSRNNITSLAALGQNPTYYNLTNLFADDNQISSLLVLEQTHFISVFATLFLRRNRIKSIPIYFLTNTLENNPNGRRLYLEGNKLNCDCNSAKVLRIWLLAHHNHILDADRILCENMPQKVLDLYISEMKLCQPQHDWTDYIYYLITAEVLLLFLLVMKVSYDYWVFKTAGYLPWPASRMPKLPCDWLCES